MTDDQAAVTRQPDFVSGNERLDQLLADLQLAADIAATHTDAKKLDRVYAIDLAWCRG